MSKKQTPVREAMADAHICYMIAQDYSATGKWPQFPEAYVFWIARMHRYEEIAKSVTK